MRIQFAFLAAILGLTACGNSKKSTTAPKSVDDEPTPQIAYVSNTNDLKAITCSGLGLGLPSCESMDSAAEIFENIASVSGAAVLTCAVIPDLVLSKGLAVGFAALGAQSKFTAFILDKFPCDASLSQKQKDEIARQVDAILAARGIKVEGPITIPDNKKLEVDRA